MIPYTWCHVVLYPNKFCCRFFFVLSIIVCICYKKHHIMMHDCVYIVLLPGSQYMYIYFPPEINILKYHKHVLGMVRRRISVTYSIYNYCHVHSFILLYWAIYVNIVIHRHTTVWLQSNGSFHIYLYKWLAAWCTKKLVQVRTWIDEYHQNKLRLYAI